MEELDYLKLHAPESGSEELALRPARLDEFIGQPRLKERLTVAITAAKLRNEVLDHLLFSGPPGLGKTTLAAIIAAEMGVTFHSTSAPVLSRPGDVAKLLTLLARGDILFIDEIHRLPPSCEEILYSAMEDRSLDFIVGEGMAAQSVKLELKPFTLIGATTRTGMLSAPLKARFGHDFKLEFYDVATLAKLVERTATYFRLRLGAAAAEVVAERSRMTPRIANRLVRRLRDYATIGGKVEIDANFARSTLESLGIDRFGLVESDRQLLALVLGRYSGGPVGIRTLAALVDEQERTLEEDYEPFLMRLGFWEKTPQGRVATTAAAAYLEECETTLSNSRS